jgi:starch phosphorylase
MWELMQSYLGNDKQSIQRQIVNHVEYTLARTRFDFDNFGAYQAAAYAVRDRLIESWNDTQQFHHNNDSKRVYYLSLEFLMGRTFQNALVNSDLESNFRDALMDMGYDLEELYEQECDAALGNGGLGRLAACFVDSLATLEIPAWGYGIRYEYGIFKQVIKDGYQIEIPDFWLNHGNPWEVERQDMQYQIRFFGFSQKWQDGGTERAKWEGCQKVIAMAYDTPVPGFNTYNTNNLRLWRSRPRNTFDFNKFNSSDYHGAITERQEAEYITSVLYPNDSTDAGKELRLKQQYFFCSASLYDIIRRYKAKHANDRFSAFADLNKIQLNDTHPVIGTIELLRILLDEEGLSFEEAWNVVYNTFSYTNHTVLPEALEKWSVELIGRLLPRHLELIYLINHIYLTKLKQKYPGDGEKVGRMSLIEEGWPKKVRMAYLAIVCSHTVNGVAALHSQLLKDTIFSEFDALYPGKLQNKTNGVTPRRWIHCCNPRLSDLISETLGGVDEWITALDNLRNLVPYATDKQFQDQFIEIKKENKMALAKWIKAKTGYDVPVDAMYDIQVKRIHEYKRQLMNILSVIHRYLSILDTPAHERRSKFVPRVICIGGKAAPGYHNAKAIIKLITSVSQKVNSDHEVGDLLKVIFLPNYNVSSA